MTSHPTVEHHLLQAALGYIEKNDAQNFMALLSDFPAISNLRFLSNGRGLIHAAAKHGFVELISALLDVGADPNMPEGERISEDGVSVYYEPGYVPLQYAVREKHTAAAELLLARGAVATASDASGGTALHGAGTAQMAELLLKAGADPNAICSMRYFNEENLGWYYAGSPLHVSRGGEGAIRLMVSYGASVDIWSDHITQRTPLHYAAARGDLDNVIALLDLRANPNAIGHIHGYGVSYTMTPIHYAIQNGHEEVVSALLKFGAQPNISGGQYRENAFAAARRAGSRNILSLLKNS